MNTNTPHLVVISAPSGTGKTTVARALLASNNNMVVSVSYTTRAKRTNESDGKDYSFVTSTTFESMIANGDFLETSINYLPALTKQHDYLLSNINVYEAQPYVSFQDPKLMKAGEIGFQVDLYYTFKKNTTLGGKYGTKLSFNTSIWNNLSGDFSYSDQNYSASFFDFGEKLKIVN